jgi:hypothetical protein
MCNGAVWMAARRLGVPKTPLFVNLDASEYSAGQHSEVSKLQSALDVSRLNFRKMP